MLILQLTLPSAAENVALDEALLDLAESGHGGEVLRIWESPQPIAVIGRSSQAQLEVDIESCRRLQIPIVRRASGGAAVIGGPGCLMYALVLSYSLRPELRLLDEAHRFVLQQVAAALEQQIAQVRCAGISDLAWHDRKISGNSVRCQRQHLLYHGTLLYNFDLDLIEQCLGTAPRQPAYRRARSHRDFVTNAPVDPAQFARDLAGQFGAHQPLVNWPRDRVQTLVNQRYAQDAWNFRR